MYEANKYKRHLNHNMQLAVFSTKVYLIGGSLDANMNEWSDEVRRWDLKDDRVYLCSNMLYKQIDFAICVDRH